MHFNLLGDLIYASPKRGLKEFSMLEAHLQKLTKDLQFETFPAKEDQSYKLSLNANLNIFIKELPRGIYLNTTICPCPKEKNETLFTVLMKANFLGQGTLGSVIGIDKDEKFLTLSLDLPYDMNYLAFREAVEDFANIVDYWKEEIRRYQETEKSQLL